MGSINRIRRNVKINDRRTSVMLELELWDALYEICERTNRSVHDICGEVQDGLEAGENFTAGLRVYIVNFFRAQEAATPPRNAA
jgi:predicted DNA-binding ribbon-helix-helix protein